MKKIVSCLLVAALALPMFAQEENAAKNEYLPAAGDFAIGFNLNPFATFVGNMFNGTIGNAIDNGEIGGEALLSNMTMPNAYPVVSLQGKYMFTDNLGLRANIGLLLTRQNNREYVVDDAALALDPLSEQKVIDAEYLSSHGGSLSVGVEYRIGKGRVQGVFSGSALYAFSVAKATYEFGNAITEANQRPTSGSFVTYAAMSSQMPNARLLRDYTSDGVHTIGLVGSVGIEGFVAPKISIGAEVNLALLYTWTPQQYGDFEGFNLLTAEVEHFTDLIAPKSSQFVFGTQNIGANLFMNFYFNR